MTYMCAQRRFRPALFLWQLQHFMNMGCLSNTVAMTTVTFLLRLWLIIPSQLINVVAMHLVSMQLQPFMNMGCLSNTFAMATVLHIKVRLPVLLCAVKTVEGYFRFCWTTTPNVGQTHKENPN